MNAELSNDKEDAATVKVAYVIYILYLILICIPILPIIGLIFAYIFENDAKVMLKTHYRYLIRTFWISLLYFALSIALIPLLVGIILIPLAVIWWYIRVIKGLKSLLRDQPILSPKTWLF